VFLWLQNSRTKSRRGWDGLIVCIVCDIECCLLPPCYVMRASFENISKMPVLALCLDWIPVHKPNSEHKKVVRGRGVDLDFGQNQRQAAKGLSGNANPPLLNKKEWFFVGDIELKAKMNLVVRNPQR